MGTVMLNPGETKNGKGRVACLDSELHTMLACMPDERKKAGSLCLYVFPNEDNPGPIKDIRTPWYSACERAGIGR